MNKEVANAYLWFLLDDFKTYHQKSCKHEDWNTKIDVCCPKCGLDIKDYYMNARRY